MLLDNRLSNLKLYLATYLTGDASLALCGLRQLFFKLADAISLASAYLNATVDIDGSSSS